MNGRAKRVGVLGASGFVGSAVVERIGVEAEIVPLPAPRLTFSPRGQNWESPKVDLSQVDQWSTHVAGLDVVINAAGNPDASSMDQGALIAANSLMPLVMYKACQRADVHRFVHVSSAVVQGDRPCLDSSRDWRPFSPYSLSKVLGEKWLLETKREPTDLVIYRPPSVHAAGRRVTRILALWASGPFRSVAGSGEQLSPQVLLVNVADAVTFLADWPEAPPEIVHHPSEGITAASLMQLLGGKDPRHLPSGACRAVLGAAKSVERIFPRVAANRRRLEMVWYGQDIAPSWLERAGWQPKIVGAAAWKSLGIEQREAGRRK